MDWKQLEDLVAPYAHYWNEVFAGEEQDFETFFGKGRHLIGSRSMATLRHDLLVENARRVFVDISEVYLRRIKGRNLIFIGDRAIYCFKKLDRNRRCSAIRTRQSELFFGQLPLEDMPEEAARFVVGYQSDPVTRAIVHRLVGYPIGTSMAWWQTLGDEGDEALVRILPRDRDDSDAAKKRIHVTKSGDAAAENKDVADG